MKSIIPRFAGALLALCILTAGQAQEPSLVNSNGTQIDTDAERAAFRAALEAQSSGVGFFDDFTRGDRYTEGATITGLVSVPQVGGFPYRVRQDGATAPTVTSGALECGGSTLYYLQNRAATPNGKFSLGLVLELERTSNYLTAVNNGGGNISFANVPMVDDVGNIGSLTSIAPAHMNWTNEGVTGFTLYPSTNLTCLNATAVGGVLRWNSDGQRLPLGEKFTILIRVEGDLIEVTAVGLGSLWFAHPDVSTKVGSDYTYFWHEPNGPTLGTGYRHVSRLHRWWAMAEELNQTPGYGLTSGVPSGPFRVPTQFQLYPEGAKSPISANTPVGAGTAAMRVAARSTTTVSGLQAFVGGDAIFEGMVSKDYGTSSAGTMFQGYMVGAPDSNLNSPVSSTAGVSSPNIGLNHFAYPMDAGDWQTIFLAGTLVGAGDKRLRITSDTSPFISSNVIADSNTSATPLNGVSGFWTCDMKVYTSNTGGMIIYSELKANGVLVDARRSTEAVIGAQTLYGVEFTTADAGGATVDTHFRKVTKVNPR